MEVRCFQWFKDTNLKANHNLNLRIRVVVLVVSNGSKILIWKQITTGTLMDTIIAVVSNGSKILIWKQITTQSGYWNASTGCFQWFKDTNLKANHNSILILLHLRMVVSNGSKILIWKQITTNESSGKSTCALFPMVQRY